MSGDHELALLAAQLDGAMEEDIYRRAGTETGYWANYFLRDLRAMGGLATARKLLNAKGTSEGFERLLQEGRLDLTVEALVLRPEFRPLFADGELDLARARLDEFGYRSNIGEPQDTDETSQEVPAELEELLLRVELSPPEARMDLRNDVIAFGAVATSSMHGWLRNEHLTGFAISALERLAASERRASWALEDYAMHGGQDRRLAAAALDRIKGARAVATSRPAGTADVYQASGKPEAAYGQCEALVDGRACANPGRHPMPNGKVMCTTHRKAWERNHH